MIDSVLLRTASRVLVPLLGAFSPIILLRGHNDPGGGFIGGLVLGLAFILAILSFGAERVRRRTPEPALVLGIGLAVSLVSGIAAWSMGQPLFAALWGPAVPLPLIGDVKLGTVLTFDIGVFIVVFGAIAMISLSMLEE